MGVAAGNELGSLACAGYECNVDKRARGSLEFKATSEDASNYECEHK